MANAETKIQAVRRRRLRRYFVMQFLPVTASLLLVLALFGAVERVRHDALAQRAQAAISAEIAHNSAELDASLPGLVTMEAQLRTLAQLVDDILNTGRTKITEFEFGLELPALARAGWYSAEQTGALRYMDHSRVQEFAALYALQQRVEDSQNALMGRFAALGIIANAMESGDPEGYTLDLQDTRADVAGFQVALHLHSTLAYELADAYRRLPCAGEPDCAQQPAASD